MLDMERQVREYAGHLDEVVAPIELEEIVEGRVVVGLPRPRRHESRIRRFVVARPWAAAASAAVVALIVIGGVLLATDAGDTARPPASEAPVPTPAPSVVGPQALQGDPGIPAFRGLVRADDIEWPRIGEELGEAGIRVTAATAADLELLFDVEYRPAPDGGMRVALSDRSRGVEIVDIAGYVVFDGTQMGRLLPDPEPGPGTFLIESPDSYASVLAELMWRNWEGLCHGETIEAPVDDLVAGRLVHYNTECGRLGSRNMKVWVDRETGLVLRVEATEPGASLPGWGALQRLLPGQDFEFVEIEFDPAFADDAFAMHAPDGAVIHVEPDISDVDSDPLLHPKVGSIAPEVAGSLLDGRSFDLTGLRGRKVAVLFWASWCNPCLDMLQAMQEYADEAVPAFEIVTVAFDDDAGAAREVMSDGAITLPVVDAAGGSGTLRGWIEGIPTILFVDEAGAVVAVHLGVDPIAELVEYVGWAP